MLLMEGSLLQETLQLKELLIVNLDLVQQQQELLAEKDRKLHSLQQENESLKSRLERMGRRMSLCQLKQSQQTCNELVTVDDNKPSKTSIKALVRESVAEAAGKTDGTAATLGHVGQQKQNSDVLHEREPPKKIRIVSSEKGKGSMRKSDMIVKEELSSRTRSNSLSLKDAGSFIKSKSHNVKKRNNSDILTTGSLYYVPKTYDGNDLSEEPKSPGQSDGPTVLVPRWRINPVHSLYVMEGTENLNDSMFLKRHQKSENEEKRRKRWDVQRLRDLHLLQKQQHKVDVSSESDNVSTDVVSLLPDPDRLSYITVDDCIPVSAFGQALPNIQTSEFSLPWSELDSDHGKTSKVKKNNRKSTAI